jgi:acetoin utilization protein AcuB
MPAGTLTIGSYMTRSPHSIGAEQHLSRAMAVMRDHGIRHLPVLHGGQLVGILSERDVRLVDTLQDVDPELVTVSDVMETEVYSVTPDTPLKRVVAEMAAHKYGSAIVMQGHAVVGIFTTVDACEALSGLCDKQEQANP